jgi:PAS domain S-box-containing protein
MNDIERQRVEFEDRKVRTTPSEIFKLISEESKVGICLLKDGSIIYVNSAFATIAEMSKRELKDLKRGQFNLIIHPDDRKSVSKQAMLKQLGSRTANKYIFRINNNRDVEKWVSVTSNEINSNNSSVDIVMMSDITQEKVKEDERLDLISSLKQKNKELESIIYTISHDLRTPLFNVRGYLTELQFINNEYFEYLVDKLAGVNLLEVEKFNQRAVEAADFISESLDKQKDLLNSIMRISAFYKKRICKERVNMNTLVESVIKNIAYRIKEMNVDVRVSKLCGCHADRTVLFQVITNLISNSIKYRGDRPCQISITGVKNGELSVYCVEDNGIGIRHNSLKNIFKPFHRDDLSRSKGDGIGLTIVKKGIALNNGSVWVESVFGQGSRFYFSLPAHE